MLACKAMQQPGAQADLGERCDATVAQVRYKSWCPLYDGCTNVMFTLCCVLRACDGKCGQVRTCSTRRRSGPAHRPTWASEAMRLLLRSRSASAAHAVRFCTVAMLLLDRYRRFTAGSSANDASIVSKQLREHVSAVRLGHAAAASAAPVAGKTLVSNPDPIPLAAERPPVWDHISYPCTPHGLHPVFVSIFDPQLGLLYTINSQSTYSPLKELAVMPEARNHYFSISMTHPEAYAAASLVQSFGCFLFIQTCNKSSWNKHSRPIAQWPLKSPFLPLQDVTTAASALCVALAMLRLWGKAWTMTGANMLQQQDVKDIKGSILGVLARPEAGASRCQSSSRELWQAMERSVPRTDSMPSHADVDRSHPVNSRWVNECSGLKFTLVGSLHPHPPLHINSRHSESSGLRTTLVGSLHTHPPLR